MSDPAESAPEQYEPVPAMATYVGFSAARSAVLLLVWNIVYWVGQALIDGSDGNVFWGGILALSIVGAAIWGAFIGSLSGFATYWIFIGTRKDALPDTSWSDLKLRAQCTSIGVQTLAVAIVFGATLASDLDFAAAAFLVGVPGLLIVGASNIRPPDRTAAQIAPVLSKRPDGAPPNQLPDWLDRSNR